MTMNKYDLKRENCATIMEFFDRIIDLKVSRQNRSAKDEILKLKPRQKREFIHYCHDLYLEKPEAITWCHNKTLELL